MIYIFIAIFIIILIMIIVNIRVVSQSQAFIIERLGGCHSTWNVGIHVKMPFIDKIINKMSLKEKVFDFPPQPVITKDNITLKKGTVCSVVSIEGNTICVEEKKIIEVNK